MSAARNDSDRDPAAAVAAPPSQSLRDGAAFVARHVRPGTVEEVRELLGAKAIGLSDEQIREIDREVCRYVAAVFATVSNVGPDPLADLTPRVPAAPDAPAPKARRPRSERGA